MSRTQRTAPFLKWVGGKSQLLPALSTIIPHRTRTYFEPFIGGGALFFHFADLRRFDRAVLNDTNPELINLYTVVRDHLPDLLNRLDAYKREPEWNTEAYFRQVRATEHDDAVERAARTIYLNRTCFNGLYRVNRSGKFNTPFGKYNNPSLYNADNLQACSDALKKFATLRTGDYSAAVIDAAPGDIVYFDPPYVPVSDTSNFTAYAGKFGPNEQRELAALFRELVNRGVFVALSNSDTPLIHELYGEFDIRIVGARRNINSKGDKRGQINEVVVVGCPKTTALEIPSTTFLPTNFPLECVNCEAIYTTSNVVCPQCGSTSTQE